MNKRIIKWVNNGPVHEFELQVPEEGLVVFEGPRGVGKSTLLRSLDDALDDDHKPNITVRDGAPSAEVDIFGQATLRRAKQTRRSGHLEVSTLSGKFSLADLVEPKYDKVASRDAVRIKAVLQLAGAEADPSLFYPLVGGQENFDNLVPSDDLETGDLVVMASQVKAALEKVARAREQESEKLFDKAEATRLTTGDADSKDPSEEEELNKAVDEATREQIRLQEISKSYAEAEAKQKKAIEELSRLKTEYNGKPIELALDAAKAADQREVECRERVEVLRERLRMAEAELDNAKSENVIAQEKFSSAYNHKKAVEALQRVIDDSLPDPVLQIDLERAETALKTARQAQERGILIRKAKADRKNAVKLKSAARTAKAEAELLREAAKATDNVLAEAIQPLGLPLSVLDGRFYITNSDRNPQGIELFEDLSMGEKCGAVIDIAIKAVGPGGMFVIPQEFYESLTDSHVLEIAERLKNSGVLAITAKAVDGEGITARVVESSLSLE